MAESISVEQKGLYSPANLVEIENPNRVVTLADLEPIKSTLDEILKALRRLELRVDTLEVRVNRLEGTGRSDAMATEPIDSNAFPFSARLQSLNLNANPESQ